VLGHYSVVMTERYAHLRPDLYAERAYGILRVDLAPAAGGVAHLRTPEPGAVRLRARKR
jgi:hypothetical protein